MGFQKGVHVLYRPKTHLTVWPGPHATAQAINQAVAAMDSCFGLTALHSPRP